MIIIAYQCMILPSADRIEKCRYFLKSSVWSLGDNFWNCLLEIYQEKRMTLAQMSKGYVLRYCVPKFNFQKASKNNEMLVLKGSQCLQASDQVLISECALITTKILVYVGTLTVWHTKTCGASVKWCSLTYGWFMVIHWVMIPTSSKCFIMWI